ncbi:Dyp-type peroxidase [Paraliomyxa miuraensis]|uniref:Dyp-type peroxidase n=1 Tax=Paraliomyxa miuraensis TaxID=376150 RepID=UPI00225B9324|nr:Dyp-type peroxidase [Paraliomyxa miuraensis]MCX4241884.1 Dyp-type peroxidase [Paraliomyxa miuraensis]
MSAQPGILDDVPLVARHLFFRRRPGCDPSAALAALASRELGGDVVGLGSSVVREHAGKVPGLREHPCLTGPGLAVPSTPWALWVWMRGDDRGKLLHRGRELTRIVAEGFALDRILDTFRYAEGRDLTGYVDGTENPTGDDALAAAFLKGAGPGLDGSSFVALQAWRHDLDRFGAMTPRQRDHVIGRRHEDDEELEDAPASAHVKRTAQESFEPEAFVLRRSMPWAESGGEGLLFAAFGRSLDAFEAQLRRMLGHDDGIVDALFGFTRPETGSYFWCPPLAAGRLDLSALGAWSR